MQKLILLTSVLMIMFSCNNKNKESQRILPESSGNLNDLSVVIDNELWAGSIGETLRETLAAPLDGLPQDEPLFSLKQIPDQVFSGFVRNNREILKIEKGKAGVNILNDAYARPQKVVVISGENIHEINDQINENADKIINAFKTEEIKENQRRISISLNKNHKLKEHLGVDIKFSSAYRVAKDEENFFWIRKDIPTGYTNLLVYELPFNAIRKEDSLISQIVKIRDSIGQKYIPGPTDGSYMITEKAYAPHLFETILDNKPTLEVKGIWDVKNAFMSGPFISYIIEDKVNNRYVVVEGFAYAPSVAKRDHLFELEAMIKSIKIE